MQIPSAATIISDAAIALGVSADAISDPYASTNVNIKRLCSLLNVAGRELLTKHDWSLLRYTYTFDTVASTEAYDLPGASEPSFGRLIDGTVWDRTSDFPGVPITPQIHQALIARGANISSSLYFQIKQNQFYIYPTPSSVVTIAFEYIPDVWVSEAAGTSPNSDEADEADDLVYYEPRLITAFLKLKFKHATGLPSEAEQREFDDALNEIRAQDGAAPVLDLGGPPRGMGLLNYSNIPDGGYGT